MRAAIASASVGEVSPRSVRGFPGRPMSSEDVSVDCARVCRAMDPRRNGSCLRRDGTEKARTAGALGMRDEAWYVRKVCSKVRWKARRLLVVVISVRVLDSQMYRISRERATSLEMHVRGESRMTKQFCVGLNVHWYLSLRYGCELNIWNERSPCYFKDGSRASLIWFRLVWQSKAMLRYSSGLVSSLSNEHGQRPKDQ